VLSLWTIYRQNFWNFIIPLPIPAPGCPSHPIAIVIPILREGVTWKSVQFSRDITNTHFAGIIVNTANAAAFVGRPKVKKLSASGGLTRGSAPGPRWGLRPQTLVIGSRSRARHGPPLPNCFRRPFRWPSSYCLRPSATRADVADNEKVAWPVSWLTNHYIVTSREVETTFWRRAKLLNFIREHS